MSYPHGMFGWVDVSVDDPDAAERFYTGLFGLEATRDPIDGGGYYVMLRKNGKAVAGIGGKPNPDWPSMWQSYISVDDVDAATERATESGGQVMVPAFDVMDAGRMAVIVDPTGAIVRLWQAGTHAGADLFNEHGTHTWNELATRDVDSARAFYTRLVGWDYSEMELGDQGTYHVATMEGKGEDPSNGGIMDMTPVFSDEVPPHWDVYFNVSDTDVAAATATDLGGSVVVGPMDAPVGRFAYLADPEGAMFYVLTPATD